MNHRDPLVVWAIVVAVALALMAGATLVAVLILLIEVRDTLLR